MLAWYVWGKRAAAAPPTSRVPLRCPAMSDTTTGPRHTTTVQPTCAPDGGNGEHPQTSCCHQNPTLPDPPRRAACQQSTGERDTHTRYARRAHGAGSARTDATVRRRRVPQRRRHPPTDAAAAATAPRTDGRAGWRAVIQGKRTKTNYSAGRGHRTGRQWRHRLSPAKAGASTCRDPPLPLLPPTTIAVAAAREHPPSPHGRRSSATGPHHPESQKKQPLPGRRHAVTAPRSTGSAKPAGPPTRCAKAAIMRRYATNPHLMQPPLHPCPPLPLPPPPPKSQQ